jgi:hypothetical protein
MILKRHEEDRLSTTMLRDFEKTGKVVETGFTRNFIGQIIPWNRFDRRNFDLARRQRIATADLYVRPLPDPNARP